MDRCRTPGISGAIDRLGEMRLCLQCHHCVGTRATQLIWLVMAVLFVAGAMSFAWALAISAYVLAERLLPLGPGFDRAVGIALAAWGAWLISTAFA